MTNLKSVNGFRESNEDFFYTLKLDNPTHKETTPFIYYKNDEVFCIYSINELLGVAEDNDIVLKAWVGKWKTDIFSFTIIELKQALFSDR